MTDASENGAAANAAWYADIIHDRWERRRAISDSKQQIDLARILEKQNSLQMSQVLPFACIGDQIDLAFQGFYKRGRFTQAMLLPRGFASPTPRRSEARPR